MADGVPPANRADLGDMDKSLWETDDKGEPKDPWQPTNYLPLMDADGNLFTFTTSSRGGLRAVGELVRRYAWHRKNNPDVHPVIALGVGSYKHTNKAYGIIKFPELSPAGYEHKGKFAAAMAAAGFAVSETVPAAEEAERCQTKSRSRRSNEKKVRYGSDHRRSENVLQAGGVLAMNRLCWYQIRPDEDPQTAQTRSRRDSARDIRGGPLSDELPAGRGAFAPR